MAVITLPLRLMQGPALCWPATAEDLGELGAGRLNWSSPNRLVLLMLRQIKAAAWNASQRVACLRLNARSEGERQTER